jgi:archaellum component FlaC
VDNTSIQNSETVASQDGVVIKRKLSGTDGGLVGIVRISADGSEPVALAEVTQPFPDGLPVEAVGFETGAEPESGEISADRAVIRQTVEGDDPVEIKFGIKLGEPVEEVAFDPPVIGGVETARMTRSNAARGDGSGAAGQPPDSPVAAVENPPEVGGTGTTAGGRRSVEARLDWLSARVEEFAAYADAMEGLIDEHGTAPELIDRIDGDLAELEGRLDALREDHGDGMDDLAERADDVERRLEAVRAELEGELDDVHGRVDDQGAAVADLEERLDGLEAELEGVRSSVEDVEDDLATATDDIEAVREDLTALREEVAELAEVSESVTEVLEPLAGGPLPHEQDEGDEDAG